jgi:hypothetical protein
MSVIDACFRTVIAPLTFRVMQKKNCPTDRGTALACSMACENLALLIECVGFVSFAVISNRLVWFVRLVSY